MITMTNFANAIAVFEKYFKEYKLSLKDNMAIDKGKLHIYLSPSLISDEDKEILRKGGFLCSMIGLGATLSGLTQHIKRQIMRTFHVAFYNEYDDIVTTTIYLEFGEWANEVTFQAKVNEKYLNGIIRDHCIQVVSWSLIEEQIMLSNISNKDKKKFDVALINSYVVYWYMQHMDGTYDSYMDRINNYLEWMANRPSESVAYNAIKFVKEFIKKHKLTDEFLRGYCSELEHNNPRANWNKQYRNQIMARFEIEIKEKTEWTHCKDCPFNKYDDFDCDILNQVFGISCKDYDFATMKINKTQ